MLTLFSNSITLILNFMFSLESSFRFYVLLKGIFDNCSNFEFSSSKCFTVLSSLVILAVMLSFRGAFIEDICANKGFFPLSPSIICSLILSDYFSVSFCSSSLKISSFLPFMALKFCNMLLFSMDVYWRLSFCFFSFSVKPFNVWIYMSSHWDFY